MSNIKLVLSVPAFCALLLIALLGLTKTASANIGSFADAFNLFATSCPSGADPNPQLKQLRSEIAAAGTVEQARALALAPTDSAIDALDSANIMLPFSDELNAAKHRLDEARARIQAASSQQQVADEFSGLMLAGLDSEAADVKVGKAECHYTTGETIAIVIGLILGIIPGLILLVLLC